MNNSLNEYLRFNFELNIELNHFLARFNVKMNNQNVSATPIGGGDEVFRIKMLRLALVMVVKMRMVIVVKMMMVD